MNNLVKKIKVFVIGLFFGLKKVDNILQSSQSESTESSSNIETQKDQNSIYDKLLKGELTQEVIEFRYQVYRILRQSDKFICDAEGNLLRNTDNTILRKPKVFETKDFNVHIVQENTHFRGGFLESIDNMINCNKKISTRIKTSLKDDYYPVIQIDKNIVKTVIKAGEENNLIDLYFSKTIDDRNRINKLFNKEIMKVKDGKRSFVKEISNLSFISENAFGLESMFLVEVKNMEYKEFNEYENYNILTFEFPKEEYSKDILLEFYSPEMEEKYKNKEKKKNATLALE